MIKKIFTLGFIFIPLYLSAMENSIDLDTAEAKLLRKSLPQLKKSHKIILPAQELNEEEDEHSSGGYPLLFCCGNLLACWQGIGSTCKELLNWNKSDIKIRERHICLLPNEILLHISSFLDSVDILKLSGTCRQLRQVFNEDFWISYLSKTPRAYSYLMLNGPLSPNVHRKAFFSHLWYSKGRIGLAAKLNHPEAKVFQQYAFYIDKNQYLCPSGVIRDISGKIDTERTDILIEIKKRKAKADIERNEMQRKRRAYYGSRWKGTFYMK